MSDPLFPLGESQRHRSSRVRPRSEPTSPRDRPASMCRKERPDGEGDDARDSRDSVVLSTSSRNASTHAGLKEQKQVNRQQPIGRAKGTASRSAPPAAAWAIPSSNRCVGCGKLSCGCQGSRLDREAVKQKLEALKMSTPYERAKLLRSTEEMRSDEAKRRQRLADAWTSGFLQLQALELAERMVVSLAAKETARRAALVAEEAKHRARAACVIDGNAVLSALAVHERESRLATTATESEERLHLVAHLRMLNELMRLAYKEASARCTVEFNEGAEWDGMVRGMANAREQMRTHTLQQIEFWKHCEDIRDGVAREWAAQYDRIIAVRIAHKQWVEEKMQRRMTFSEAVLRSAHDIEKEEGVIRRGIAEEMHEDAEEVVERHRIFARSCQSLLRTETAARQGILEELSSSYHGLFLDFRSEAEEVAAIEKLKAQRREAEADNATAYLQSIARDEADEFAALLSREIRERDLRYSWKCDREAARLQFAQQSLEAKAAFVAEEEEARRQVAHAMQRGEIEVQERTAQRLRHCRETWNLAVAEKDGIGKEEHDSRFRIISCMAEEEESIRHWCECRANALVRLIATEDEARGQAHYAEESAWRALLVSLAHGAESIERRQREFRDAVGRLAHKCSFARGAIEAEEADTYVALLAFASAERQRAVAAEQHRAQLAFQLKESQSRTFVMQEESGERAALSTAMALGQRFLCEEAQQLFQASVAEVLAAEQSARTLIVRGVEEGYEALCYHERDALRAAISAEKERIAAELRAREQCVKEDPRLYATAGEEEVLVFPDGEPQPHPPPRRSTAASAESMKLLKTQLVLQELGVHSDASLASLDPRCLDYLVAVVDGIHGRRAESRDRLRVLEKNAKDATHRAAQKETIFLNEKEKKEANAARLERDSEEQERRLHNDKADRQRGNQQIEYERRHLEEVLALLGEKNKQLADLKASINKQYGRA